MNIFLKRSNRNYSRDYVATGLAGYCHLELKNHPFELYHDICRSTLCKKTEENEYIQKDFHFRENKVDIYQAPAFPSLICEVGIFAFR